MSKQAQVGIFTIFGIIAVFAVFFVLNDIGRRASGYKLGVHFREAAGLHPGGMVYLSGIQVGAVDAITLLPDYSTEVVLALDSRYGVPVGSTYTIAAPITGDPTVQIEPPKNPALPVALLPHGLLPVGRQPVGSTPASINDLLAQSQGEVVRLDDILSKLQATTPKLLSQLDATLRNANALTTNANASLVAVTGKIERLTDSLGGSLTTASSNVVDLTTRLDSTVRRNSGSIDELLADVKHTSKSFGETVDSLRDVAADPKLKGDLTSTADDFATTARTFAAISGDLRKVTGSPQTQGQLRDAIGQLDATTQKVNSLLGELGATSSVAGIDAAAAAASPGPAPTASDASAAGSTDAVTGGFAPSRGAASAPAATPRAAPSGAGGPAGSPLPPNGAGSAAAASVAVTRSPVAVTVAARPAGVSSRIGDLRKRLDAFTADLYTLQYRVSLLAPLRPGDQNRNLSPLLGPDRGPRSDFNLFLFPRAGNSLEAGVNDVGSAGNATANVLLLTNRPGFTYGGGIEYSQPGLLARLGGRRLGFETRAYDLRHPTLDTYVNLFARRKAQLFLGERDLTRVDRRSVLGLQLEF